MAAPHFWLSEAQCARLQPLLPTKGRGVLRVADRRVLSGLIPGIRNGFWFSQQFFPRDFGIINCSSRVTEELPCGPVST